MSLANGINDPKYWISLRTRLYFKDRLEKVVARSKIFLGGHGLLSKYNPECCRETLIYFIRNELLYVNRGYSPVTSIRKEDSGGILTWPDWNRWYSYMFFETDCQVLEKLLNELCFVSKEIVCHLMAQLFGETAYNLKIWVGKVNIKENIYGGSFKPQKVLIVKFPNCFLSSPAAFSIFVSHLRKAVYLVATKDKTEKGYFDRCLTEIQDQSGSYEKMRNIIKSINTNVRDPFRANLELRPLFNKDSSIIYKFPLEFFDFAVNDKKTRDTVFSQHGYCRDNVYLTLDSGYQHAVSINSERLVQFAEYLKSKGIEV